MHRLLSIMITGLSFSITCSTANAEEGGNGHYVPGSVATLIDWAPTQPGWVIQPLYLHYEGDFSKSLPLAGTVSLGLDATVDSLALGGFYTFEQPVLGAHYSAAVYVPYVWVEVTGNLGGFSRTDKVEGIGDITLIPVMLAWKSELWQFDMLLNIYAPTGDYKVGRLANEGLNYWTFDPTLGATYSNEETGFNFGVYAGVTVNTENKDTHYHSGSVLHIESSVQQLLPAGAGFFGFGLNAFLYDQITGDSGAGTTQDFKGRSVGVGPVFSYILPFDTETLIFEAKWLPELDTKNRLKGNYIWVKAVYQF